jgi:hypothetical protein
MPLQGATIVVSPGQKIQDAINSAAPGDSIKVNPGTYAECINFRGKQITVISASGPASTIIDGSSSGPVVTFDSWEQRETVLQGFTIRNGTGKKLDGLDYGFGGGILCRGSSPTIRSNIIEQNHADPFVSGLFGLGGGISIYEGSYPEITNNTIRNNTAESGGGIYIYATNDAAETAAESILIQDNSISANSAQLGGAIFICGNAHPRIINNVISGNTQISGEEVFICSDSSAEIVNPTTTTASISTTTTSAPATLIVLSVFKAVPGDRQVALIWKTESEIDNAGFNIYRSLRREGPYKKINISLISAQGMPMKGASYKFVDQGLKNGETYFYKLEDIDLSGKNTFHGPVSATPRIIYGIVKSTTVHEPLVRGHVIARSK